MLDSGAQRAILLIVRNLQFKLVLSSNSEKEERPSRFRISVVLPKSSRREEHRNYSRYFGLS